jgi:hypothetical protein
MRILIYVSISVFVSLVWFDVATDQSLTSEVSGIWKGA